MFDTTGQWYVLMDDGREIPFYHDHEENVSPLERIKEFDKGEYWILDIKNKVLPNEFEEFQEEDSFVLVPKEKVIRSFFKFY